MGALKVREDLCAPPARELLDARIQTLHVWLPSARISDAHHTEFVALLLIAYSSDVFPDQKSLDTT